MLSSRLAGLRNLLIYGSSARQCVCYSLKSEVVIEADLFGFTNYQLPNGPVKAGRRWGQRHPQGANLNSNGILKFLSKTDTMAATSPP